MLHEQRGNGDDSMMTVTEPSCGRCPPRMQTATTHRRV